MRNKGKNIIVSLGDVCKWLGNVAEQLGVDVLTGFGGAELVYENNRVVGIATSDTGVGKKKEKLVLKKLTSLFYLQIKYFSLFLHFPPCSHFVNNLLQ